MKTKLFSALAVAALVAPVALSIGSASADAANLTNKSTATFNVTAKSTDPGNPTDPDHPSGTLALKAVPDIDFGTVEASQIFNGKEGIEAKTTGALEVDDNRLSVSGWKLDAALTDFTDGTNTLAGSKINLKATGSMADSTADGKINATSSNVSTLAKGHGNDVFKIDSDTLDLAANPDVNLTDGATMNATINWTLSSDGPVEASL